MPAAIAIIRGLNLALALSEAATAVMSKVGELQAQREAEGRQITDADLESLMAQGDIQAALDKVRIAQALAAKAAS